MTKISNQYSLTNVLFADAVNGRVGIGTTSPTGKFSVNTGASNQIALFNNSSSGSTYNIISLNGSYSEGTNMGIEGGDSGDANLYVNGGYASSTNGGIIFRSGGASTYTERMRITSAGNVGIGTSSPFNTNGYTSFTINGTTGSIIEMLANGTRAMQIVAASSISYFYGALNTPMAWYTNANERMRITEGGDVCVATTSSSYSSANRGNITIGGGASALLAFQTGGVGRAYAYHDGSNYSIVNNASGGGIYMSSNSGGVVLSSGATSWASSSDERLKNINSNIEDAVSKLSSLRAVNFSWKSDETQKEVLGLIAQDVEKVFPQVVDKSKLSTNIDEEQIDETEYLGVRYTELIPVLVKAIQEQTQIIEDLKTRIVTLELK